MSPRLDELSLQFAIWTRTVEGLALDVGCGDGVATAAALSRGGRVAAVDPDRDALRRLCERIPLEQHARLKVIAGKLRDVEFKQGRLTAVHAAYVLHLLDGEEIESSFRRFFRWLQPGGRLFISALTPAGAYWRHFRAEFARRLAAGAPWPGYVKNVSRFTRRDLDDTGAVHLLDERLLRPLLTAAGFSIETVSEYTVPWDSEQLCCAITARCDG